MLTKSALLCKNANHHLVKRHNVDPAAEANVLRVEAVDALLLQPLLRERVIGCQRGGENRRNDKRQDVETVEEGFFDGALQVEGRKEGSGRSGRRREISGFGATACSAAV